MLTWRPVSALSIAAKTMARLRMLSAPRVSGSVPSRTASEEVLHQPEVAADAVTRIERRHLHRLDVVEEALSAAAAHLGADVGEAVPGQRAFLADDAPGALPAGAEAVGAPAAGVGEDDVLAHVEDGRGGGALAVPGACRLPFAAEDAEGPAVDEEAGGIEGVDRHVEEEHVVHLLAEPAEVRGNEEVAVDAGRRADRAGGDEAADAARLGEVAAVLDHRVDAAGVARRSDDRAGILRAGGERLLGQDVAAVAERGENDLAARRRDGDVEDDVGLGLREHCVEVGADGDAVEIELAGALPGAVRVDVDQAGQLDAGLARGTEPRLAHRAAANEDSSDHPGVPPPRLPLLVEERPWDRL